MTKEERLQVERETRDQMMRDLSSGNVLIHGMKLDAIIAGIQNMKALVPGNVEDRIREFMRVKAAEEFVEVAEAVYGWSDVYEDHMGPDDFDKRERDRARFREALAKFREIT